MDLTTLLSRVFSTECDGMKQTRVAQNMGTVVELLLPLGAASLYTS